MSTALWGTVAGVLPGQYLTDRWGRRQTLLVIAVLYLISALGSAFAPESISFSVARWLGGLGIGISTIAAPVYITELAPASMRGRLTGLFQLNIVAGIVAAYISNALLAGSSPLAWRIMLLVEAFPAVVFLLLTFLIPESPAWLALQSRANKAGLTRYSQMQGSFLSAANEKQLKLKAFAMAIAIAAFNQLSGINAILYYAPRIFHLAGFGAADSFMRSISIGIVNLIFTIVGLLLIDRVGRRRLMLFGSGGYIVSLAACSIGFAFSIGEIIPLALMLFIAAHALGQGTVIWVFISEIFPDHLRAAGQAAGSLTPNPAFKALMGHRAFHNG